MAGYTAIANLESGASARGKLNTQFNELFGENAKALVSVADAAALAAIPAEYLSTGKLVYQVDIATVLEWSGAAWAAQTGPITPTDVTASGALDVAGATTLEALDVAGVQTNADMANLNGGITVTPADDRQAATLRRNSAGQTSDVLEIQTEANAHLAGIDAAGNFDAVDGDFSGDLSGATVTAAGLSQGATGAFGDVAGGDYSEFEADGTLKFNGAATVWNDLILPASNLKPGASAPTFAAFLGGVFSYRFDAGAANELHGAAEIQHDYMEGSDLYIHVHWSPTTTNTGNIVWGMEYTVQNVNGTFGAPTTVSMTPAAAPGVVARHVLSSIGTITGTGLKIGAIVAFRVFRQNGGTDTFTGNAFLHSVGIHYESDTAGSRQVTTK